MTNVKARKSVNELNREIARTRNFRLEIRLVGLLVLMIIAFPFLVMVYGVDFLEWVDKQDPVKTGITTAVLSALFGGLLLARGQVRRMWGFVLKAVL